MKKLRNLTFTIVGSIVVYEALRKTGALDKIKGSVKQKLGKALQDPHMQFEGTYEKGRGIAKDMTREVKEELVDHFN